MSRATFSEQVECVSVLKPTSTRLWTFGSRDRHHRRGRWLTRGGMAPPTPLEDGSGRHAVGLRERRAAPEVAVEVRGKHPRDLEGDVSLPAGVLLETLQSGAFPIVQVFEGGQLRLPLEDGRGVTLYEDGDWIRIVAPLGEFVSLPDETLFETLHLNRQLARTRMSIRRDELVVRADYPTNFWNPDDFQTVVLQVVETVRLADARWELRHDP